MFSELGLADGLPATQEAVTAYRELAAANPDRYRPDLARSLDNLGVRFSELGLPAYGLPATQEAVTAYRELAAANPDRYRPDLARSLDNLGVRFSQLGRRHGLPATQEAVTAYRELAAANPDRYRPDLARSLDNLGARSRSWPPATRSSAKGGSRHPDPGIKPHHIAPLRSASTITSQMHD